MTKPTELPEWASSPQDPNDIVTPSAGRKLSGWHRNAGVPEKPPYQLFNWLHNLAYRWISWLDSENTKLNSTAVFITDYGAVCDGTHDDTEGINAAILAAGAKIGYGYMDRSVDVVFPCGKSINILGEIVVISGTNIVGNGSILYGTGGTGAFSEPAQKLIRTGYWNGSAIVPHLDAQPSTTNRIVGTSIKNLTISSTNCALSIFNMQETCEISNIRVYSCRKAIRMRSCFYLKLSQIMVRNTAPHAGDSCISVWGDSNAITFEKVAISSITSVGIHVDATPTMLACLFSGCTFEEGYATSSVGMLFDSGYAQGITISNCYFEGVRTGIKMLTPFSTNGVTLTANYFSSCEYSLLVLGVNVLKYATWDTSSIAVDGAGINNILSATDAGNGLRAYLREGHGPYPDANIFLGESGVIEQINPDSVGADTFALMTLARGAHIPLSYAGRGITTTLGKIPYGLAVYTPSSDNATADGYYTVTTSITHDISNFVCFIFNLQDYVGTYKVSGFIFGEQIFQLTERNQVISLISPVVGSALVLRISGLTHVTMTNISGAIRHL